MTPLLQVKDLTLQLHSGDMLVGGVSFQVDPGERVAMVGESGSGKSLTMLAIAGLLSPAIHQRSGEVRYKSARIDNEPPARRRRRCGADIGVVFQEPMTALNPVLRIEAQLMEARRRLPHASCTTDWVEAALASMAIDDPTRVRRAWPHQLSGGMCQRVLVAMALAAEPGLVLADEPTTALDALTRRIVMDRLYAVSEQGAGVILVTHDLASVRAWAQTVLVMKRGRLCESGPAQAVFDTPQHPYTRGLLACAPDIKDSGPLVELESLIDASALDQQVQAIDGRCGRPWWPGRTGYSLVQTDEDRRIGISVEP